MLSTLRVGFEPCCLPLSVERARDLVAWTLRDADGLVNVQTHAQNFHSATSSAWDYMRRIQEWVELVRALPTGYAFMDVHSPAPLVPSCGAPCI